MGLPLMWGGGGGGQREGGRERKWNGIGADKHRECNQQGMETCIHIASRSTLLL